MKITDITVFPVWGGRRNFLFVVVDTDEGIYGVGEAGIVNPAVAAAVEHFKPVLIGEDPMRIEHIWQVLYRGGFFPAQRILGSAISAIDIALWDILGKALNVPIYQLLGGKVRDKVPCYPHNVGHAMEIEPLVESCLQTKEEGWKFVRWGLPNDGEILEPRQSILTAIKQMQAVREAVGDEIEITFDVHTRLDLPDAVWLCREVEQFRPYFIEDPLRSENPDSFKTLRPRVHVPLAAGEQFSSKWEFRQMIEEEWIDYARIDLCICGGITESRKIANWCETHYIKLVTHNPLGPVSSAACLQLNMATSNFGVQEQPRKPSEMLPEIVPVYPEWQDGYLLPPDRPGLGIEFDREAARRHPAQEQWRRTNLRRLDGSFTNW
jgi:L-alanine-DL-glutamate epimerase-like enolase superfamily enzyme